MEQEEISESAVSMNPDVRGIFERILRKVWIVNANSRYKQEYDKGRKNRHVSKINLKTSISEMNPARRETNLDPRVCTINEREKEQRKRKSTMKQTGVQRPRDIFETIDSTSGIECK